MGIDAMYKRGDIVIIRNNIAYDKLNDVAPPMLDYIGKAVTIDYRLRDFFYYVVNDNHTFRWHHTLLLPADITRGVKKLSVGDRFKVVPFIPGEHNKATKSMARYIGHTGVVEKVLKHNSVLYDGHTWPIFLLNFCYDKRESWWPEHYKPKTKIYHK